MKEILESFETNLKTSYLTYALSVITSRAIPDLRDGLKPVQRRILYSMYELKLLHNRPFKKSARVVGETLGKYHPHGDAAIYDALVRMAQSFSMNHVLVEGQGNFGSIDGDPPAAMRYTEVRLSKIAEEMFKDIDYDTVKMLDNFDNTLKEPEVLPARFPNILINGASGIAVGLSTEIPPHNLSEIIEATIAILKKHPDPLSYIQGPDFPTGGVLYKYDRDYLTTGKGMIELLARYSIEDNKIIITEIPYMVNKSTIIKKLYEIKESNTVRGIRSIIDKSGKNIHIEIVIDRNYKPEQVLNSIINQTELKKRYYVNMIVLDQGRPVRYGVLDILRKFIEFRRSVLIKRATYFRLKYEQQLEKIESYIFAVQNIDKIIPILKDHPEPEIKLKELGLTDRMIEHILNMNLRVLKKQELQGLLEERQRLKNLIDQQLNIIANPDQTLIEELEEIKINYGRPRKTIIDNSIKIEDYDYKVSIIYSKTGLKKILEIEAGKNRKINYGKDLLGALLVNNNSKILVFSDNGIVYKLDVQDIENRSRDSEFEAVEKYGIEGNIVKILPYREQEILVLLENGNIKRMKMKMRLSKSRYIKNGVVVDVNYVESDYVTIVTEEGKAIRFKLDRLKLRGKGAGGVKGIEGKAIRVITSSKFIVGSKRGYVNVIDNIRLTDRGGKGVYIYKNRASTGGIADACNYSDEILVIIGDKIARIKIANIKITRKGVGKKIFERIDKIYNV